MNVKIKISIHDVQVVLLILNYYYRRDPISHSLKWKKEQGEE